MPRKSKLLNDIKSAISSGKLAPQFNSGNLKDVFLDKYADSTYKTFLNKHRRGNPGNYSKFFIKTPEGFQLLFG